MRRADFIMASSSVSQEDVDNDFELSSRRTRIRTARACRNANPPPPTASITSSSSITAIPPSALASRINDHHALGCGADHYDDGPLDGAGNLGTCLAGGELRASEAGPGGDHNDASPKPLGRAKEKRVNRANHLNKGKQQRDRRKLREKRRSTGVVHLPSTESTGGSTGEDEDEGGATGGVMSQCPIAAETRRNTQHNEHLLLERAGAPDGSTPETNSVDTDDRVPVKQFTSRRNKSPSDLEADDEDNQEFDSLNQSDSATGSAPHPPTPTSTVAPLPPLHHPHHSHHHHHHHHHHRHQTASSQSAHTISTNNSSVTQGERVPNGNRPGTPTGENMEELLERAQEENRRLLRLLEERDRRIASLEARVSVLREEKEQILRQAARAGKSDLASDGEASCVLEVVHGDRVPIEGEGISKV